MKRILSLTTLAVLLTANSYAQANCTPVSPTGIPGLTPEPQLFPCAEINFPYSASMNFENFAPVTVPVIGQISATIIMDSILNLPCGISWQSNPANATIGAGQTGCIELSGSTTDAIGQYKLIFYITVTLSPLSQTFSGEASVVIGQINALLSSFGLPLVDATALDYWVRVTDFGVPCAALDTTAGANNLISSGLNCPTGQFTVSISGNTSVCSGSSTTLTASAQNATGSVIYEWSPVAQFTNSITVSPASTTTYTVIATDMGNNDKDTASVTVVVSQSLAAGFTIGGTDPSLTFTNTTTGTNTYAWNFGDGSAIVASQDATHTYTADGTYTVTLIATNVCGSDTATQQVVINNSFQICIPDTTISTVGFFPADSTLPCIEAGIFYDEVIQFKNFTLVNGDNIGFPGVIITIDTIWLTAVTNLPSGIGYVCNTPGCIYTTGENGCVRISGLTNDPSGIHRLGFYATVKVSFGGFQTTVQADSQLLANAGLGYSLQVINTTVSADTAICEGDSVQLVASGGSVYDWSPPIGLSATNIPNPVASPSQTISYTVAIADGRCSQGYSVVVEIDTTAPVAAFNPIENNFNVLFNNTSSEATEYLWDFGDGTTSGDENPQHLYDPGIYDVTLIASNDCGLSDTFSYSLDLSVNSVAIRGVNAISVYPNPGSGIFELRLRDGKAFTYEIISVCGEIVKRESLKMSSGAPVQLNLAGHSSGIYFLKVTSDSYTAFGKIMLQ